jgi:hypothetical protein
VDVINLVMHEFGMAQPEAGESVGLNGTHYNYAGAGREVHSS